MPNGNMQRVPVELPRKPGVFALVNKSRRFGYVAFTSDLQKRAHSLAHMLQNPKTHWAIRDLPKDQAKNFAFTLIDEVGNKDAADRIIRLTKKSLAARKYSVIEGSRPASAMVRFKGKAMTLTEAIAGAKCRDKYITVWRRLDRGWSIDQALGLADPPERAVKPRK